MSTLRKMSGADHPAPPKKQLLLLRRYGSGNPVKGGVGDIVDFHLNWPINHCR
jgi:hypothetical protein